MNAFIGEYIGTTLLLLLGDGVVANVLLSKTKGNSSGWLVITMGWAMAVFVGVYVSAGASGAHLNPAVTIGLASIGQFEWSTVPAYIGAQMLGAMTGAFLVWVTYRQHFNATTDPAVQLGVFCNAPAIRHTGQNLLTEMIATFVLMMGVLMITKPETQLGSLDALPVALLILGIGLGLGGPTGYAINPARDLGPRIVHALLPLKNKGTNDWSYSWIPVIGPIVGAITAAWIWLSFLQ